MILFAWHWIINRNMTLLLIESVKNLLSFAKAITSQSQILLRQFCWICVLYIFASVLFFIFGFNLPIIFFLFSYLKSITPFFCVINNFPHQCPIKCYFIIFSFFLIILRIGSSQPEVFRKRVLWDPDMFFGETLRRALAIFFFFSSFFIIIIIVFLRILLKSQITSF